jgi:aconitate hydratase
MGVLPLEYTKGETRLSLGITGQETVDILGIEGKLKPRMTLKAKITRPDGSVTETEFLCRIDTLDEVEYFRNGGILPYVLRNLAKVA